MNKLGPLVKTALTLSAVSLGVSIYALKELKYYKKLLKKYVSIVENKANKEYDEKIKEDQDLIDLDSELENTEEVEEYLDDDIKDHDLNTSEDNNASVGGIDYIEVPTEA